MLYRMTVLFFLSLLFLVPECFSQISATDSVPESLQSVVNTDRNTLPLHKLNVGIQLGTQFMTTSGYGSGYSTFLSPTLTYPVSKRFLVSGGISIVNTSLNGYRPYYSFPEQRSYSGNITQGTLWISGQYQVNNHLSITGTAYKTFDLTNDKPGNSPWYKNNPQGAYLNFGYRINDYLHIDAGFGYSKGYNPYNPYDPFNSFNTFEPSPFGFGMHGR